MSRTRLSDAWHFLRSYFSSEPSYLIFFVTAACNARCKHCFYWEEIASADARGELKLPEIEKIAASLRLIYLSIGGGEPFLRSDLGQVVEAFYNRSGLLYCNIVTNGFYVERIMKTTAHILERCPRLKLKIQVSFDDFEKEHDEYRKVPGIYAKALESLRRLSVEVRAKNRRFNLDIATCLTRTNKGHATALYDDFRSKVEFDYFQFLYPRGNAEYAEEKEVSPREYEAALGHAHARDFRLNHNPILAAVNKVAKAGIMRFLEKDEHPWDCLAGQKFISITEKGVLQPCEVLHQMKPEYDSDIATLRDYDFDVRKALAGQKAREVVSHILDTKCRCSFECAANCNVVFAKKEALRVVKTLLTGSA